MDYEKKYNEALERAKKFEEKYGGGYAEYIFPELAESEDEKIRKLLVWQVHRNIEDETNDLAQSVYGGIKGHDPDIEESIEDWKRCLAWLEKQKENPKSADSIPSDCASDAKCEDRWHKVSDSLPDNGRLVLAKDCLGNVLLARYDGENWEVNVYDNEDHYCHNSISKWCEIPSEKQKEQKPNIELIQRSWYMEGYHDREFGKEPKWIIKTGEGGPKHELNPRYGQPLTEQRPTEEQLHNLNEAIKSYRMDGCDRIADSLHSLYNILNTPEQKPADLSEMMVHKEPYIAPVPTPMVADEQKHTLKFKVGDKVHLEGDDVNILTITGIEKDRYLTDNSYGPILFGAEDIWERIEQKPAEWSEEDEEMLDIVLTMVDCSTVVPHSGGQLHPSESYKKDISEWLKSCRPSWKPSEHQMNILKAVKEYVGRGSGYWGEGLGSLIEDLEKL